MDRSRSTSTGAQSQARPILVSAGLGVLAVAWLAPLDLLVAGPFTRFMVVHVAVVAVAAPLIALGLAGGPLDPIRALGRGLGQGARGNSTPARTTRDHGWHAAHVLLSPVAASVIELLVVWGWHAPGLHAAARSSAALYGLEQTTFLGAGLLVWISAFGGDEGPSSRRRGEGVFALLLTSMHMTLLGALLALPPRPLYHAAGSAESLADQHMGGAIMIGVGGVSYLIGGLLLTRGLLSGARRGVPTEEAAP